MNAGRLLATALALGLGFLMLTQAPAQAAEDALGPCLWGLMKPEVAEAILAETDYDRASLMVVLAERDETDIGRWGCGMAPILAALDGATLPPDIVARTAYFGQRWSERRLVKRWSPEQLAAAFAAVPEDQLLEAAPHRLKPDGQPTAAQFAIYKRFLGALKTTEKDRDGRALTTYFRARAARHWAAGELERGVTNFVADPQEKSTDSFPGIKRVTVPVKK